jgi:hypothetical protein
VTKSGEEFSLSITDFDEWFASLKSLDPSGNTCEKHLQNEVSNCFD